MTLDQTEALRRAAIWLNMLANDPAAHVVEVVDVDGVREVMRLREDLEAIEAHLLHLPVPLLVEWVDASDL